MTRSWEKHRTRTRAQEIEQIAAETQRATGGLEVLQELAVAASQATRLEPVLEKAVELICRHTGWPVGHVYYAAENGDLDPSAIWCISDETRYRALRDVTMRTTFRPGVGLPGEVYQARAPVWVPDVGVHANFPRAKLALELNVKAAFALPVISHGNVTAVLEFFAPDAQPPDMVLLSFSRFVGSLLGAVAERIDADRQRRSSEALMRDVVQGSHDAFVAIDTAGLIREWNPAAERIFGWTAEEVTGKRLADTIVPPNYREAHTAGLNRLVTTGETRVVGHRLELPGLRKDGSEIPLELTIAALPMEDGFLFHAFLRDISDRKHAQKSLEERERQLEEAQRLASIGSWEWDVAANRVTWSRQLYEIYGLDADTFPATFEGYLERVHPDDRERVQRTIGAALQSGDSFEFDERIVRPDGDVRHLHSRGEVRRRPDGAPAKLVGSCLDVTNLRRAVREAEELGHRLQTIFDTVAEGICGVDMTGTTTFANRAACRMLGHTARELTGLPFDDAVGRRTDSAAGAPPLTQTLQDGEGREVTDESFSRADGTSFPVSYTIAPIRERGSLIGAVITFIDLTERRKSEDEARRALFALVQEQAARAEAESMRAQLHRLFEQAPALVALTYGPDHVFELTNPLFMELIGNREVVGKAMREALPEMESQGFGDLLDSVYQTGQPYIGTEMKAVVHNADGEREGYFNFAYQPLLGSDQRPYGILIHAVEVSELVRNRMEVERNAAELRALAEKLERTNKELDQFAYIASHDLKAPLRGVSNIASWLEEDLDDKLSDETREYVKLMKNRIARMEDLINALLAYSRAGRVRGDPQTLELDEVIAETIEIFEDQKPVEIVTDPSFPQIFADPVAVRQVFQNLISNAVKYAATTVRVGVVEQSEEYHFYVQDDGPGIESRFHDRIWGMFQRLHAPGEGEGTGVGLAIVKKVVEANHGRVWLESSAGAGSTFWIAWPKTGWRELDGGQDP